MDNSKSLFSDLTLTVATAPDRVQSQSVSAITYIPEYTTIKGIFSAAGAHMQVSDYATSNAIEKITIDINKYQVAMLNKKGAPLIEKGGNSYSMNALTVPNNMFHGDGVNGDSMDKFNG